MPCQLTPPPVSILFVFSAVLLLAGHVSSFQNCSGVINPHPVNHESPVLKRAVPHGKLYEAGHGADYFYILHLYGSHYDMGFAHGQLTAHLIPAEWQAFINFIEKEVESYAPWIPQWLADIIAERGAPIALQLVVDATRPFTPVKYIDEMRGIAAGANFSFDKVYQLNMFPELIKGDCTILGATKSATLGGNIVHLRTLDFPVNVPGKNWPLVTVMHGDGSEPVVANFGWVGLIGSLTGLSETPVGIGQKVWLNHDHGISSYFGQPWMLLLRDALYAPNLDDAIETLRDANRTCAIFVGIGDGNQNEFRGIQMAHAVFNVSNWTSIDYPEHPVLKDIMYWDKNLQPTTHWCLSSLLKTYAGRITALDAAVQIAGYAETGTYHSVAFDYKERTAYFANARKNGVTEGPVNAYQRQYTFLNMSALFLERE